MPVAPSPALPVRHHLGQPVHPICSVAEMLVQTFSDLKEHGLRLAFYCTPCQRWTTADIEGLIAAGRGGEVFVGRKPRCADCGAVGTMQVQIRNGMLGTG